LRPCRRGGAVWLMSFQIAARPAPAARAWRNLARRGIEEMR
jgi:hypothetical protein